MENMVRHPSEFVNKMLSDPKRKRNQFSVASRREADVRDAGHNRDSRFLFRPKATPNHQPTNAERRIAAQGGRP
jgi:hypothetical protein